MKKIKYIYAFLACLCVSFLSTIYCSFLGPLALLSLPSGIESLLRMKEFSKIKNQLIKLLPYITLVLIILALLLLVSCIIIVAVQIKKMYRAFQKRRLINYIFLLHSLQVEFKLNKEIRSSSFLQKLYEKMQRTSFRKQIGLECALLIDQSLDILLGGTTPPHDQEKLVHSLILLLTSKANFY